MLFIYYSNGKNVKDEFEAISSDCSDTFLGALNDFLMIRFFLLLYFYREKPGSADKIQNRISF